MDGVRLDLAVFRDTHVVEHATFRAPTGAVEQLALLDQFCEIILGLPLVEASDHGVIRLEDALRDRALTPPVPGIITPEAAHPMFLLPLRLIRGALAEYRKLTGFSSSKNEHDPRPGASWMSATPDLRIELVMSALEQALPAFRLSRDDVHVAAIRHDVRVELRFSESWKGTDQQNIVMSLERELKARVDSRLEVYVEERKDKNKIRRLAVVGSSQ